MHRGLRTCRHSRHLPWRDVLQEMGVEAAARRIRDAGLRVTGLCRGGMFPAADAAGRAAAIEDNRRAIAEAAALGADCLVMVCGGLPPGSKDLPGARAMVREGPEAILPEARAAGVRLALEPLHPMTCADRSVLSTLKQALDLCEALGEGVGVAVDVYHVWWDPDLAAQMARAAGRIAAFHVSRLEGADHRPCLRPWPAGRGVIDIPAIRAMAQAAGWGGGWRWRCSLAGCGSCRGGGAAPGAGQPGFLLRGGRQRPPRRAVSPCLGHRGAGGRRLRRLRADRAAGWRQGPMPGAPRALPCGLAGGRHAAPRARPRHGGAAPGGGAARAALPAACAAERRARPTPPVTPPGAGAGSAPRVRR